MDVGQPAWEKVDGKWIVKKPPEEMWESAKGLIIFFFNFFDKIIILKMLKSVKLRKDTMTLENGSKYGKRGKNDL